MVTPAQGTRYQPRVVQLGSFGEVGTTLDHFDLTQRAIDQFYQRVDEQPVVETAIITGVQALYDTQVSFSPESNNVKSRSLLEGVVKRLDSLIKDEKKNLRDAVIPSTYQSATQKQARYNSFAATAEIVQDAARTLLGYMQMPELFAEKKAHYDTIFSKQGVAYSAVTSQNASTHLPEEGVNDLTALMQDPIVSEAYKTAAITDALLQDRSYDVVRALTPLVISDPNSGFRGLYQQAQTDFMASLE